MTCAETKEAVEPLLSTSSGSKVEQLASCERSDKNMTQDQLPQLKRPSDTAFSYIPVIPAVVKKPKRWRPKRPAKKKKEKKEDGVDVKISEQYLLPNHRF